MNNPNPLIPQGSLQSQKGKANVRIAVFTILAIHVVLLGGLLMQGCKREEKAQGPLNSSLTNGELTVLDPAYYSPTNLPPDTNVAQTVSPADALITQDPLHQQTIPPAPLPPTDPTTTEYTVVRGDSFYKIAKARGLTVAAIAQANPGVDSTKLKVGQMLRIPAASITTGTLGTPAESTAMVVQGTMPESSSRTYVVKAGDTLTRIARRHGTSARAIRVENNLPSDTIKVGQKLRVPVGQVSAGKSDTTQSRTVRQIAGL